MDGDHIAETIGERLGGTDISITEELEHIMRSVTRTTFAIAAAAATTLSVTAPAFADTTNLGPGSEVSGSIARIAGMDRVATSLEAAKSGDASGVFTGGHVIIARSDDYPDALTATPLADCLNAPVLLTNSATLDQRVADYVAARGIKNVTIAGSAGAVSTDVEDSLRNLASGMNVVRVGGVNRYQTAAFMAKQAVNCQEGSPTNLVQAELVLGGYQAAQRNVVKAEAKLASTRKAMDAASAALVAQQNTVDTLAAQLSSLAKQLKPTAQPAGYASWDAYVAEAKADFDDAQTKYQNDVAQQKVFTGLLGTDAATTLNTSSTLQQYMDQFPNTAPAIQKAIDYFNAQGANMSPDTTLNDAIAVTNSIITADNNAIASTTAELAKRYDAWMVAAANNTANEPVLKQMATVYTQLQAAQKQLAALTTAYNDAQAAYKQAVNEYNYFLVNEPTPQQMLAAQKDVDAARASLNAVAGRHPVYLATGKNFPDALSAGAASQSPLRTMAGVVLLSAGPANEANTAGYLAASKPQVVAIGGDAAAAVKGDKTVAYYVGNDRYATAALVAKTLFPKDAPVAVASGQNFADAVVASAYIANHNGALVLTANTGLSAPTKDYFMWDTSSVKGIRIFGGSGVVTNTVRSQIAEALLK